MPGQQQRARPGTRPTRREIEVLALAARGLDSQEIADELFVSKRTVDFHLWNAYQRFGVKRRMQAVNAARERGLIP